MIMEAAMETDWELREARPLEAERTVLLLPGGMCSAGSYAEVMAEPALAGMRLVAATLPGHAGAPPPDDYSVENYARLTAELAKKLEADVARVRTLAASARTARRAGLTSWRPDVDRSRGEGRRRADARRAPHARGVPARTSGDNLGKRVLSAQ